MAHTHTRGHTATHGTHGRAARMDMHGHTLHLAHSGTHMAYLAHRAIGIPQACGRGGAYADLHGQVVHVKVHGRYGHTEAPPGHTRIPAHPHPCHTRFHTQGNRHTREPPHAACTHCQGTVPWQPLAAGWLQAPAKMCEVTLSVVHVCLVWVSVAHVRVTQLFVHVHAVHAAASVLLAHVQHVCMQICTFIPMWLQVCTHAVVYAYICMHTHVWGYLHVCANVRACVCVSVHT